MAVGIVIKEPLKTTDNPAPTAEKRLNDFLPAIDWEKVGKLGEARRETGPREKEIFPALDTAALSAQYGIHNAHKPVLKVGTFQVPLGINERAWESYRGKAIKRFLSGMYLMGWDLANDQRFPPGADAYPGVHYEGERTILVYPGPYPAHDLRDQTPLLDRREYRVAAHFRFRNPKPRRVLVPPELLKPLTVQV